MNDWTQIHVVITLTRALMVYKRLWTSKLEIFLHVSLCETKTTKESVGVVKNKWHDSKQVSILLVPRLTKCFVYPALEALDSTTPLDQNSVGRIRYRNVYSYSEVPLPLSCLATLMSKLQGLIVAAFVKCIKSENVLIIHKRPT